MLDNSVENMIKRLKWFWFEFRFGLTLLKLKLDLKISFFMIFYIRFINILYRFILIFNEIIIVKILVSNLDMIFFFIDKFKCFIWV